MEDYYKRKALKYYLKLKNLEKMSGGNKHSWYNEYFCHVKDLENSISSTETPAVLTGSGALALLFHYAGMYDLLECMDKPNDIDFVYVSKGTNYFSQRLVKTFTRVQTVPQRSVSFMNNNPDDFIKSFDFTQVNSINSVIIDGIHVINPYSLLSYYLTEDDESKYSQNAKKINLLKRFLCKIKENAELNKLFSLEQKTTKRKFDYDNFDNEDNEKNNNTPVSRNLFF